MEKELFDLLRHRPGEALGLTVTDAGEYSVAITNHRGETGEQTGQMDKSYFARCLRASLAYYPEPVTINGEVIPTSPPPTDLQVVITRKELKYNLDPENCRETGQPAVGPHSIYSAGVLLTSDFAENATVEYHALQENTGNDYWSLTRKIKAYRLPRVSPEELIWERQYPHQPRMTDHSLEKVLNENKALIRQRIETGQLPPPALADLFHYAAIPPFIQDDTLIAVTGTPVHFDEWYHHREANPAALIRAMYQANQLLVPVGLPAGPPTRAGQLEKLRTGRKVQDYIEFSVALPEYSEQMFNPVPEIEYRLTIQPHSGDGKQTIWRIKGDFHIAVQDGPDLTVWFKPESTDPAELEKWMNFAVELSTQEDEAEEEYLQSVAEYMSDQVTSCFNSPAAAMTNYLTRQADNMHCPFRRPDEPVTVTSGNGRITITYNPDPDPEQPT